MKLSSLVTRLSIAFLPFLTLTTSASASLNWKITRTAWTASDEKAYSEFVAALGKAKCNTVAKCIKSPANPYRSSDPANLDFYSDCADLPYFLRTYFAWKNGLPFSFVSSVRAVTPPPGQTPNPDIRYSPYGNVVGSRFDVVTLNPAKPNNVLSVLNRIGNTVMTGTFRFDPSYEGVNSKLFPDFYSAELSPEGIRPGTVIYDPNGHVAVVYEIAEDGRIFFMDAHPDNSLTRGTYGMKFARSRPSVGSGFKNFRTLELVGATRQADGTYVGGRVVSPKKNVEYPDFSVEQYYGNQPDPAGSWKKGQFVINGRTVAYYDYVRERLAKGSLSFNPTEELTFMLQALCQDIKDRADSVQLAIAQGVSAKDHPPQLPRNIYGTDGEWESFSTPSRDARLKTSVKEMHDRSLEFLARYRQGDSAIHYSGADLKQDLLGTYDRETRSCTIQYKNSAGVPVTLTLSDVIDRIFSISFDPYHCVELRWGAAASSAELASCRDSETKRRWYGAQQSLRNTLERNYEVRMDFTLEQLEKVNREQPVSAPAVDLRKSLSNAR